jgi:hypothetical protein
MTTLISFVPSTTAAFSFGPALNGVTYNATVTWNVFGQRYYLNLSDLSNNLILCTAIVPTGPSQGATVYWNAQRNVAVVTTAGPHNIPIGCLSRLRLSGTGTNLDGSFVMLATGSSTLNYAHPQSPPNPLPLGAPTAQDITVPPTMYSCVIDAPLNLVAGIVAGLLLFHDDTQQFEFA